MNMCGIGKLKTPSALAVLAIGCAGVVFEAEARNAVGYIKRTVPAGLSMMSVPFELAGGGAQTLDSVFGDTLADASEVIVHSPTAGYTVYSYYVGVGWVNDKFEAVDTVALPRGTGFWVNNTAASAIELILRGQVPTTEKTVPLSAGVQMVSFGFAAPTAMQLEVGLSPNDGDEIFVFLGASGYEGITYYEGLGWYKNAPFEPSNLILEPGASYWYSRVGSATTWIQSRPY